MTATAVAVTIVAVTSCGTDTDPAREAADDLVNDSTSMPVDRGRVHDFLVGTGLPTGVSSDQALEQLLVRRWDDQGAAVATTLSWIGTDARSTDSEAAQRAAESASALARFLAEHREELLNLEGAGTESFGQANPAALDAVASALAPYIPNLVEADRQSSLPHFSPPANDPTYSATKNIVSVIASGKSSITDFATAAFTFQQHTVDNATTAAIGPGAAAFSPEAYGRLIGVLQDGVAAETDDRRRDTDVEPSPNFDGLDSLILIQPYLDFAAALQRVYGPLEHGPELDYLFHADGTTKNTTTLLADGRDHSVVGSDLRNLVLDYRGGAVETAALQFGHTASESWRTVR